MRAVGASLAVLLLLTGCSDPAAATGGGVVVDRLAEPWVILHQQSEDGSQERIIAQELGVEPSEGVVLYGPEPSGALVLCPSPEPSVLRGSPGAGYVMDTFFDDGESFGFEPTSLGPHRVTHCPVWSYATGLGVAFAPESPEEWGSERTVVFDPSGDTLRVVPLELPDERAGHRRAIGEGRFAVEARNAQGSVLRIVDIAEPSAGSVVHRYEGADDRYHLFEVLEGALVYTTPAEPREIRAHDLDAGSDTLLTTLLGSSDGVELVPLDDVVVVVEYLAQTPVNDMLVVRDAGDGLEVTQLDLSAIPARSPGVRTAAGELLYRFETAEHHGYAMVDPRTTDAPRVVARFGLDEWMLGPTFLEPLGLAGGTVMRDETPSRQGWFALDGSTPDMEAFDLDITGCDDRYPPVMHSDQATTFWFFCERDGVPHAAQWSPSTPEQRPQWEANVRRVDTTEGEVVLSGPFELADKLIGTDVEDPGGARVLIDLPSRRARPLPTDADGWTASWWFFPELAE